jgi:P27 family predicted phage terminase small subunit
MRGRKPTPTALRRANGNPGKRGYNADEPVPPDRLPDCPDHLNAAARAEWHRIAEILVRMGVVSQIDRAVLAAYCQAYGRWVEAEEKLRETPVMMRTPSGYVQQNPWLGIVNRQLDLMARFMAELGLTPASRSRIRAMADQEEPVTVIFRTVVEAGDEVAAPATALPRNRRMIEIDPKSAEL